jgi:hypothetical protein
MTDAVGAWRAGAALARFRALGGDAGADAAAAALIADDAWVSAILDPLVANPADAWHFAARRTETRSTIILDRSAAATLTVTSIADDGGAAATAVVGGRLSFARVLAGRGTVERRRAGRVGPRFTIARAAPLGPPRRQRFGPGTALRLDGRRESWRIRPDRERALLLTITLECGAAPLIREYTADGGALRRVAANDGEPARAAMLTALLTALPPIAAAPGYAAASAHPAFFVRWQAMRGWLTADPQEASPRLAAMANGDPHPEVRAAARTVRAQLESCRG